MYIAAICLILTKISVTMYQICRLQYLFSGNQLKFNEHKYHWSIFYALYFIGFFLSIYFILVMLMNQPMLIYDDTYQCNSETASHFNRGLFSLFFLMNFLWDSSVLCACAVKIYQIQKKSTKDITIHGVSTILRKITMLTILFQLS